MNIIIIDYAFTSDEKLRRICDELKLMEGEEGL